MSASDGPVNIGPEPEAEGIASQDTDETIPIPIPTETVVVVFLYSLWILLILVGNIFVVTIILKKRYLRQTMANAYIVSVLLARACIGCFVVPARITAMFSERYLGRWLCKLCHFAALGSSATSVICIAATAWMQYAMVRGMTGTVHHQLKQHVIRIVLLWVIGFIYGIRAFIMNDIVIKSTTNSDVWTCTTSHEYEHIEKYFVFVDLLFLFVIPSVLIVTCYCILGRSITITLGDNASDTAKATQRRSIKTVQFLVVLVTFFILCTLCPMTLKIYTLWVTPLPGNIKRIESGVYLFSYANSWAHLIVLFGMRQDIRKEVARTLYCSGRESNSCMRPEGDNMETKMYQVEITEDGVCELPSVTGDLEWRDKRA